MAENEKEIGSVLDYFAQIEVAAIKLRGKIKIGDKIRFRGSTTNFNQTVESMQIDHKSIEEAKKGDDVGIKVDERVRRHDKIYLLE